MLKFSYCAIFSAICLSLAYCDSDIPSVVKKPPTKEEFDMSISEQGWKYTEKIIFDMSKKNVVHNVPAHRNLTESNVMDDYISNMTITRFLHQRVCYIRPKSPEEPTLDDLKKSMDLVSSQKHKMKEGFQKIAMHWVITGHADVTKLSEGVVEFCHGMEIYEVEKYDKNGANVIKAISRKKRSDELYVLCRKWTQVRNELTRCPQSQWVLKCKFTLQNCFHYVTCDGGEIDLRNGRCTSTHKFDDFTCCTPSCP